MAKNASAGNVQASIRPPNFRAAVKLIRHDIKAQKDRISSINETIGEKWGVIEGHGVDKLGARVFMMLDKLPKEERLTAFRTINGLADVAEWPESEEDLVDQAQGKVVPLRMQGRQKKAGEEGGQEPAATKPGAMAAALEGARKHLGGTGQPADEAPQGDNDRDEGDEDEGGDGTLHE